MANWPLLIDFALVYGITLSVILVAMMITSGLIAPDMWVGDYPLDIKNKYGPMSAKAARLRPYFAVLFFGATIATPLIGLFALRTSVGQISLLPAFVFSFIVVLIFNVFDLLILDWLFFCTIQPRIMVLPGTEGMAGYRDYRFHFIGFLKGLGFCTAGSIVIALLWLGLQYIVV
jgi:hypothetical protein